MRGLEFCFILVCGKIVEFANRIPCNKLHGASPNGWSGSKMKEHPLGCVRHPDGALKGTIFAYDGEIFGLCRMWIIYFVNCEILLPYGRNVKWNSPPHICEANILERSYFTWRSQISLAEGEFRWKKRASPSTCSLFSGGATRIRTGGRGVADLCLTTWPWRRI